MYNIENEYTGTESSSSTSVICRSKRMGTKHRRSVIPPVAPDNDSHLRKVWWNYWEARSWQHKHQVACWRSQVEALQYENRMLHEYIKVLLTAYPESAPPEMNFAPDGRFCSPTSSQKSKRNKKRRNRRKRKARNKDHSSNESDDSELHSDIDEDLLNFMEITIRHQFERDNHPLLEKNEDQKVTPECQLQPQELVAKNRLQEMRELFGPAAPKLLAMETAMQLTFNSNCDRHHPKLWPVLPLAMHPEYPD